MPRRPVSAASKAKIAEGLRRYWATHHRGGGHASPGGQRGVASRPASPAPNRQSRRAAARGNALNSGFHHGEVGRGRMQARADRHGGGNSHPDRHHDLDDDDEEDEDEDDEDDDDDEDEEPDEDHDSARGRLLHELSTPAGRARAERDGHVRRTADGGLEPTERGRQALNNNFDPGGRPTHTTSRSKARTGAEQDAKLAELARRRGRQRRRISAEQYAGYQRHNARRPNG